MLAFLCASLLSVAAQAPAPSTPPVAAPERARELAARFELLHGEYARAESAWIDAVRAAAADLERRKALQAATPVRAFWARFDTLASEGEGRARLWCATRAENGFDVAADVAARKLARFEELAREHMGEEWALEIVQTLGQQRPWLPVADLERLLELCAARATRKDVAATALAQEVALLRVRGAAGDVRARIEALNARLRRDYAETEPGARLLAAEFREAHLLPGRPAPAFRATDVEGVAFELADYRGKVVLLDFWAFWCAPCRAMLPHERKLALQHKDDPFALLGVSADDDKEQFRALAQQHGVTWRNAWQGSRGGALSQLFQIEGYPTLILIDAQGVIRKLWVGPPGEATLEREIDALIALARTPAPAK